MPAVDATATSGPAQRADGGVLPIGEPDALQLHKGPERLDVGPIVPLQLVVASVGVHSHRLDAARGLGSEPILAQQQVELQADRGAEGVSQQLVRVKRVRLHHRRMVASSPPAASVRSKAAL